MSTNHEFPKTLVWLQADDDLQEAQERLEKIRADAREAYQAAAWELIDAGYRNDEALIFDHLAVVIEDTDPDACPMGPKLAILRMPSKQLLQARKDWEEQL